MKTLCPLLATALLAAAGPCETAVGSSGGAYGLGPGPFPSEWVTSGGKELTVYQTLGDRMFTQITSRYDSATLKLMSSERRASCCLTTWLVTVARNADGTYVIESRTVAPSTGGNEERRESSSRLRLRNDDPIIVGGFFLVPWIRHVTKTSEIARIDVDPLRVQYLAVRDVLPSPYPDGVSVHDKALLVTAARDQATLLWYDPCTFTLDAYGANSNSAVVRSTLMHRKTTPLSTVESINAL